MKMSEVNSGVYVSSGGSPICPQCQSTDAVQDVTHTLPEHPETAEFLESIGAFTTPGEWSLVSCNLCNITWVERRGTEGL